MRNLSALSTRLGVLTSPSRSGSSPSSVSRRLIRSCIVSLYVAACRCLGAGCVECLGCHNLIGCRNRPAGSRRRSRRALQGSREPGQREEGGGHLGGAARGEPEGLSNRPTNCRGRVTGLGTNGLPEPERKAALEAGIAARDRRLRSTRSGPRATSGSPPTWARSPNHSACGRGSSIAGRSRTRSSRP